MADGVVHVRHLAGRGVDGHGDAGLVHRRVAVVKPVGEPRQPIYLGDGLYAEEGSWPGEACVYASNGLTRTNQVYLDAEMLQSLYEWFHRV